MASLPFSLSDFVQFLCGVWISTNTTTTQTIMTDYNDTVPFMNRVCTNSDLTELSLKFAENCPFLESTDSLLTGLEDPCAKDDRDPLAAKSCGWWRTAAYPNQANTEMHRAFCHKFPEVQFSQTGGLPKEVAYVYLCKWNDYTHELTARTFQGVNCDADNSTDYFVSRLHPDFNGCPQLEALNILYSHSDKFCSDPRTMHSTTVSSTVCDWWNDMDGGLQEIVQGLNAQFCQPSRYIDHCGVNSSRTWPFHAATVLSRSSTVLFYAILFPVLLVASTIGNVMSIIVFISQKDKKSATVYLTVICLCDLIHMWSQVPRYVTVVNRKVMRRNWTYNLLSGMIQFITLVSKDMSDWTLTVFAIERTVAVTRPLRFRGHAKASTAWTIISVEFIVAIIMNLFIPVAAYYQFSRVEMRVFEDVYRNIPGFDEGYPHWIKQWGYFTTFYRVTKIVAIFIILILTDVIVSVVAHQRGKTFKDQAKSKARKHHIGDLNLVMILSSSTYLLTQAVTVVTELLIVLFIACFIGGWYTFETYWNIFPAQITLSNIGHSFNFLFYIHAVGYRSASHDLLKRLKSCQYSRDTTIRLPLKVFDHRPQPRIYGETCEVRSQ